MLRQHSCHAMGKMLWQSQNYNLDDSLTNFQPNLNCDGKLFSEMDPSFTNLWASNAFRAASTMKTSPHVPRVNLDGIGISIKTTENENRWIECLMVSLSDTAEYIFVAVESSQWNYIFSMTSNLFEPMLLHATAIMYNTFGPLLLTWTSKHIPRNVWDEITYPISNFNDGAI